MLYCVLILQSSCMFMLLAVDFTLFLLRWSWVGLSSIRFASSSAFADGIWFNHEGCEGRFDIDVFVFVMRRFIVSGKNHPSSILQPCSAHFIRRTLKCNDYLMIDTSGSKAFVTRQFKLSKFNLSMYQQLVQRISEIQVKTPLQGLAIFV